MTKKSFTLLFALLLQAAFVLEAKQVSTKEEFDLISIYSASHNVVTERHHIITADITSHMLTVSIHQNVGIAQIMIRDSNGAMVELGNILTSPETTCIYISECGYYRVDIVLSNGDIYYGYFTVRDGIII
ncbi:MAG: DUF3244 domain-containing protein [Bacteroidales bacterium]|nr:DUF3244 domain-containing protein [Bacteroidales bacterium]